VARDIRKIDRDNNGYLLASELNKIFKTYYGKEMEGKTLSKAVRQFASIQNR